MERSMEGAAFTHGLHAIACTKCRPPAALLWHRQKQARIARVPAVAERKAERRGVARAVKIGEVRLHLFFKEGDRPAIRSEEAHGPFYGLELPEGNPRIVLHNRAAVREQEIPRGAEFRHVHQVRRGLYKAPAGPERIAEFRESGIGFHPVV